MAKAATIETNDVIQAIGEESVAVDLVLKLGVTTLAIGQAWARGEIQFGKRDFVNIGKAGSPESQCVVEQSWNWTGPKLATHQSFREIMASEQNLPEFAEYREYPAPDPKADPNKSPLVTITAETARKLTALHVKLTDKGLTRLEENPGV